MSPLIPYHKIENKSLAILIIDARRSLPIPRSPKNRLAQQFRVGLPKPERRCEEACFMPAARMVRAEAVVP